METVLMICGIISAIGAAGAVIYKIIVKPFEYIIERLDIVDDIRDG